MSQEQLAILYERCIRPVIANLLPEHIAHWPLNYAAALMVARDDRKQLHFGSRDIPSHVLPQFAAQLRERLETIADFKDSFFLHEWRGLKGATVHDPTDDEAADNALETAGSMLDLTQLGDPPDLSAWWIDIGVEVSAPGRVLQWLDEKQGHLVKYALLSLDSAAVRRILRSKVFHTDVSSLLYELAGFRVEVPVAGAQDHVCYLNAYTTDKSVTYQLHRGAFRRHRAQDLLPQNIRRLLNDMEALGVMYDLCAGASGPVHEGAARFEVRTRMMPGVVAAKFQDLPRALINKTLVAYRSEDWW